MNALFATQSLNLKFHYRVAAALRVRLPLDQSGFYVSDSMFFRSFLRDHHEFAAHPSVLKEWDILAAARGITPEVAYVRAKEREYAVGPFWDAFACDRRIMQGSWCRERQNYRARFDHDELLRILDVALHRIEELFDVVRPEVVFSLVPVTFGEYLIWMCARARGIPTLFIYTTKILNYMCWMDSFFGRAEVIVKAYEHYQRGAPRDEWIEKAERYVAAAQDGDLRHEGMVPIPGKVKAVAGKRSPSQVAASIRRSVAAELEYWTTESRHDNHIGSPLAGLWHQRVAAPFRSARLGRRLSRHYLSECELISLDYLFYPLHAEPEIALSIQGKSYQNQIETIRNIARNLPAGMLLVTKEHPRSIGYHPYSYYEKLLRIPNVRIASPLIEARKVIQCARLVAAIWSFVAFEAVLCRKPVVTFGTPLFSVLPDSMIRHVTDLSRLNEGIRAAVDGYGYDERAVIHHVAACMAGSEPLDFYAQFLKKRGRYRDGARAATEPSFDAFTEYTVRRVNQVCRRTPLVHA